MTRLLAALLSLLMASPASAAVVTISVKDSAGTSRTFNVTTTTDITGNLSWNNTVCDQATGATCASVGTAGSPSTNALTVQGVTIGHGAAANAMRVELPTDGTGIVGLAAGTSITTVGFPGASPTTGTPIAVTTGGVSGTLPTGAVVVASNVGSTNIAFCKLGASATTADQPLTPGGGWFAFTVGAATQLTCITSTSTTTVNMVGGAGFPNGTGGGGGGGSSGGAVTIADGADVALGTTSDVAWTSGSGTMIALSKALNITAAAPLAAQSGSVRIGDVVLLAGAAHIGVVTTDQTTPGTTDLVHAAQSGTWTIGGVTASGVAVSENPFFDGGRAQNAEPTAVGNGQKVGAAYTLVGKEITLPYANPENAESGNPAAMTDTASHAVIASAGVSLRHYVTDCLVTNSDPTNGSIVLIQDGSTTIAQGFAAANGGGFMFTPPVPRAGTLNTALNAKSGTAANIIVSCGAYKGS